MTTTALSPTISSTETDTAAAVAAGIEIAGPQPLAGTQENEFARFFTQVVPAGATVKVLDIDELEQTLADRPRRKKGTVHVQDAISFIRYVEKHQLPGTEVYADAARQRLVAVVNAHDASEGPSENDAGHGDHRVALELIPTEEWKTWTSLDKKPLNQQAFAEHLEDNAADVIHPDAATMLEIASSLIATNGVNFKQAVRLDNGQVQVRYEETTSARAGHAGDLEIPQVFTIAVAPFVGSEPVEVTARFRYRINGGNLALSYALLRPEQIARQAFLDHVEAVADAITPPVFQGRPE